jgi:hypothetical protein
MLLMLGGWRVLAVTAGKTLAVCFVDGLNFAEVRYVSLLSQPTDTRDIL